MGSLWNRIKIYLTSHFQRLLELVLFRSEASDLRSTPNKTASWVSYYSSSISMTSMSN